MNMYFNNSIYFEEQSFKFIHWSAILGLYSKCHTNPSVTVQSNLTLFTTNESCIAAAKSSLVLFGHNSYFLTSRAALTSEAG